jgi:hypothetical protein
MKNAEQNTAVYVLGVTKTGKTIYEDPKMNADFKRQDHLDAYRAHAQFLMHNLSLDCIKKQHLSAMNEHYLQAVRME